MTKGTITFVEAPYAVPHTIHGAEEKRGEHPFLRTPSAVIIFQEAMLRTNRVPIDPVRAPGKMKTVVVVVLICCVGKEIC